MNTINNNIEDLKENELEVQNIKKIALIGRANVGKSTIFNRLSKNASAIVSSIAGITRDRNETIAELSDLSFKLIDTAGVDVETKDIISNQMNKQSLEAIRDANLIFFVISAKDANLIEEKKVAEFIRRAFKETKKNKPVILVANKSENVVNENFEFESLGFGPATYVSAEHNIGFADLYTRILKYFERDLRNKNQNLQTDEEDLKKIRIAIAGRPNVGKSTLINSLLKEERLITSDIAGTTTDSVTIDFKFEDQEFQIIDTAGQRKSTKISSETEKLFVAAGDRSVNSAHIVILVIDANAPFEKQDLVIANNAMNEGKCVIVALNKWDLIEKDEQAKLLTNLIDKIGDRLAKIFKIIPISALNGLNVDKLMTESIKMYNTWNKKLITNKLNLWLNLTINHNQPKPVGNQTPKLQFVKQVGTRPISIAIFGSRMDLVQESYLRYLESSLRTRFKLDYVPIRIFLRQKDNPFAKENRGFEKNKPNKLTKISVQNHRKNKDSRKQNQRQKGPKTFTFASTKSSDRSYSSLGDNMKSKTISLESLKKK